MYFKRVCLVLCLIFANTCDFSVPSDNELYDNSRTVKLFEHYDYNIVAYSRPEGFVGIKTRVPANKFKTYNGILSFDVASSEDTHYQFFIEVTLVKSVYTKNFNSFRSNFQFNIQNSDPNVNEQTHEYSESGSFLLKKLGEEDFLSLTLDTNLDNWINSKSYYQLRWEFIVASGKNSSPFTKNSASYEIDLNIYASIIESGEM